MSSPKRSCLDLDAELSITVDSALKQIELQLDVINHTKNDFHTARDIEIHAMSRTAHTLSDLQSQLL